MVMTNDPSWPYWVLATLKDDCCYCLLRRGGGEDGGAEKLETEGHL